MKQKGISYTGVGYSSSCCVKIMRTPTPDIIASVLYDNAFRHTPNSIQQPPPSPVCNCASFPTFLLCHHQQYVLYRLFHWPVFSSSLILCPNVQSRRKRECGSKSRESWRSSPSGNTIRLVSDDGAVSRIANPSTASLTHITPASARGHYPDSCGAPSNATCISIRCS